MNTLGDEHLPIVAASSSTSENTSIKQKHLMINYKRTTCRKCRCFTRTNEHSRGTVMFKTKSCTFLCFFFLAELLSFSGSERRKNIIQPFKWIYVHWPPTTETSLEVGRARALFSHLSTYASLTPKFKHD